MAALRSRYNRGGGLPGLEEAIEQIRAVLAAADPRDDLYSEFQYSLGTSLVALYQRTTDAQTLAEAVRALRGAAAAVRPVIRIATGCAAHRWPSRW